MVDASHSIRIDADFFRSDYIAVKNELERIGARKLSDFRVAIKHPTEIKRTYVDEGVFFLRAQNIRPMSVDLTANPVFISGADAERLNDNSVHYKDILLTRTGANFGQCAIYLEDTQAIASSHTFIINGGSLNPFFLTVFLNTRHGRAMIDKGMYGGLQPEVAPAFLQQIPIPDWDNLPGEIERAYRKSQDLTQLSKDRYDDAQAILLSELGLTDWQPRHQPSFVRNFSDAWGAGRVDADYFQPKYEELVAAIKDYAGGWDTLGNLVNLKDKNFKPEDQTEYQYIELANIGANGEITGCMIEPGQDLPSRARRKTATGDVIVSSIEGSLESIALINGDYDQALCSTGFHVINSKTLNSETVLVLLKSMVGQLQLKKGCSGTILSAINKDAFNQLVLPVIVEETQAQIRQQVAESAALRRQSKHLLECAKRAVEIAIEQDETTAIAWLEQETSGVLHSYPG